MQLTQTIRDGPRTDVLIMDFGIEMLRVGRWELVPGTDENGYVTMTIREVVDQKKFETPAVSDGDAESGEDMGGA